MLESYSVSLPKKSRQGDSLTSIYLYNLTKNLTAQSAHLNYAAYDMENELYIFGINIDLDETYVYETLIGDVSDDGVINIKDITAIQYHIAKTTTLKGGRLTAADTNRDGRGDILDATGLQKYIAEIISER